MRSTWSNASRARSKTPNSSQRIIGTNVQPRANIRCNSSGHLQVGTSNTSGPVDIAILDLIT